MFQVMASLAHSLQIIFSERHVRFLVVLISKMDLVMDNVHRSLPASAAQASLFVDDVLSNRSPGFTLVEVFS